MTKTEKVKKRNKLVLVENGLAFLLLMLIILGITTAFVYFISVFQMLNDQGRFLYANQESLHDELDMYADLSWAEREWARDLPEYNGDVDEFVLVEQSMEMSERVGTDDIDKVTEEMAQQMSEQDRNEILFIIYQWITRGFQGYDVLLDYSHTHGPMYVYWDGTAGKVLINGDDDPHVSLGSWILDSLGEPIDIEANVVTSEAISSNAPARLLISFMDDEGHTCFGLVTRAADSSTNGYIITYIEESYLKGITLKYIDGLLKVELVIILISFGIFMLFFYFITVKPLSKVKKGLQKFANSRDTDKLIEDMQKIKVRNEIGRLSEDISNMAVKLAEYEKVVEAQAKARTEMALATEIQASMLPDRFPTPEEEKRFEIYASMKPAKEVGGDLYDFFFIDDDHLVLEVGDVSGKGVPASLFMMMAKTMVKDKASLGLKPGDLIREVNDELCENNKPSLFITIGFMVVELSTGRVTEVNAGHMNPVVLRAGGDYEMIKDSHSMVVGIMEDMEYEEKQWQLNPGDRVFIYSDGVTEAENGSNDLFGNDALVAALNDVKDKSQKEILEYVGQKVYEFADGADQSDDITMLGFTYFGTGKE